MCSNRLNCAVFGFIMETWYWMNSVLRMERIWKIRKRNFIQTWLFNPWPNLYINSCNRTSLLLSKYIHDIHYTHLCPNVCSNSILNDRNFGKSTLKVEHPCFSAFTVRFNKSLEIIMKHSLYELKSGKNRKKFSVRNVWIFVVNSKSISIVNIINIYGCKS